MKRTILLLLVAVTTGGLSSTLPLGKSAFAGSLPEVKLVRVPDGGLQPQALTDAAGAIHLIYLKGNPGAADVYYTRLGVDGTFSAPLRVNSRGAAIATGTVRGPHLAVGKKGRVHVAWMGARVAAGSGETPMLYTRLDDRGAGFEPERNVMQFATGLDGGASVAADMAGNVYVAWHAGAGEKGEAARRVWVARSRDEGGSFEREVSAWTELTGVCGCCGMRASADAAGRVYMLYRSATEQVHRDIFLLRSDPNGTTFRGARLDGWTINACPMSTASLWAGANSVLAAWETAGQVSYATIDPTTGVSGPAVAAPGSTGKRRHPAVAANRAGQTLLVWSEGTGWQRGGSLAWQLFDPAGQPTAARGEAPDVAVWSLAAAVARPDGSFLVVY